VPGGSQPKSVFSHLPSVQWADRKGRLSVEIPTFAKVRRMTGTAGIDMNRTLWIAAVDVAKGRKWTYRGPPREDRSPSLDPNASAKSASLANSGTVVKPLSVVS
jgi:hypothetical protein